MPLSRVKRFRLRAILVSTIALGSVTVALADKVILPPVLARPSLRVPQSLHALLLAVTQSGNRLVAVGEHGVVLLSDDAGGNWRQATSVPTSVTLTAVRFTSHGQGWAVGHMGLVLHSTDGGETWSRQLEGVTAAKLMQRAADGLPSGPARDAAEARAHQLVSDGPDKPFFDLLISNTTILAVGANGLAVRSDDSGTNWVGELAVADPNALHLYAVAQSDSTAVMVGEQGLLLLRRNGSRLFESISKSYSDSFFGVISTGRDSFIAFGLGGLLVRSIDGGETWVKLRSGFTEAVTCAALLPDGRILIGSESGRLSVGDNSSSVFSPAETSFAWPIADVLGVGGMVVVVGPIGPVRLMSVAVRGA